MKQNQLTKEEAKDYLRIGFNIRLNTWLPDSYVYADQDFSVYNEYKNKLSSHFEKYIDGLTLFEGQYWELYKEPDILRKVCNKYNPIEKQAQLNLYEHDGESHIIVAAPNFESAHALIKATMIGAGKDLTVSNKRYKVDLIGPVNKYVVLYFNKKDN